MPELPEVETVVRGLSPVIEKKPIIDFKIIDQEKLTIDKPELLNDRTIETVSRIGKWIVLTLSKRNEKTNFLTFHLRMTGKLLWDSKSEPLKKSGAAKYERFKLFFNDGTLSFSDVRRFGDLLLLDSLDSIQPKGVDPVQSHITDQQFQSLISKCKQSLKAWLMRQDKLVGVGNIYASEILFDAGLSPLKICSSLTSSEASKLNSSTRKILERAIVHCGTTFSDFQTAYGVTGEYQNYLSVYKRESLPCRSCDTPILKIKQQGRSTFYCPSCQPNK